MWSGMASMETSVYTAWEKEEGSMAGRVERVTGLYTDCQGSAQPQGASSWSPREQSHLACVVRGLGICPDRVGFVRLATALAVSHVCPSKVSVTTTSKTDLAPISAHIYAALRNACRGISALVSSELPTCFISETAWQPLKEESVNFYLPFTRLSLSCAYRQSVST